MPSPQVVPKPAVRCDHHDLRPTLLPVCTHPARSRGPYGGTWFRRPHHDLARDAAYTLGLHRELRGKKRKSSRRQVDKRSFESRTDGCTCSARSNGSGQTAASIYRKLGIAQSPRYSSSSRWRIPTIRPYTSRPTMVFAASVARPPSCRHGRYEERPVVAAQGDVAGPLDGTVVDLQSAVVEKPRNAYH